jgi:aldehyde:ferredoxin oxidoreductase
VKRQVNQLLRVNLSEKNVSKEDISSRMKHDFIGGRGFAVKLLWDEVKKVDSLSANNKLIFSTGPLSGQVLPSAGKMVIASKSPLNGGYGDGSIGSMASVHLRKAGYDVLVVEGKSERPCYLLIEDESVKILDARGIWGKNTFETEDILHEKYGKNNAILDIGPSGENQIQFAMVMSQKGRAGGRPGMGAVMGSKNLKAIVVRGTGEIPIVNPNELKRLAKKGYAEIKSKESYDFWIRQGTMLAFDWCNENSCLPVNNFREGVFEHSKQMDGYFLEKIKVDRKGCPACNMKCGNIVNDLNNLPSEVDYENVGLLGPNIGLKDFREVALLNRLADELGLDAIALGSCIGFLMEASEKGLIPEKVRWGDFDAAKKLVSQIGRGEELGELVSHGLRMAAEKIGGDSYKWSMDVKNVAITAYNCHACPGMALSYGTSPIGASHKDAWIIAWEIGNDRLSYSTEKVKKLIEQQNFRGGFFESATVCRFPWVEVNFGLEWYLNYFEAITGDKYESNDLLQNIGNRIYHLMRAYSVREKGTWNRQWDYPPDRWFEEPQSHGKMKGVKLDREKYNQMLSWYYELRGWDKQGVPKKPTLDRFGLNWVSEELWG